MAWSELSRKPIPGKIADLVMYAGSDPGAGVELSEVVPARKHWVLREVSAQLVTSAAVANRNAQLVIDDGAGNIVGQLGSGFNHVASTTKRYSLAEGDKGDGLGTSVHWPLPDAFAMGAGHRIKTVTAALDVADDWGPFRVLVEETTF